MNYLLEHSDTLLVLLFVSSIIIGPLLYFWLRRRITLGLLSLATIKDSPITALGLSEEPLRAHADDPEHSVVCDWREDPQSVVDQINVFVPASHRLELSQPTDSAVSIRRGRHTASVLSTELSVKSRGVLAVVGAANALLAPDFELRSYRCFNGSDSYAFHCAPSWIWSQSQRDHPKAVDRVFERIPPARHT